MPPKQDHMYAHKPTSFQTYVSDICGKQKGLHHVAPFVHQYLMVMRELLFHFSDGFSTFHFHFNTTVW